MSRSVRIFVSGRVQGVFFRASAREQAQRLDLRGYARNLQDGRVEILVSGSDRAIEEFIRWSEQGPVNARVDDLWMEDCSFDEGEEGFSIG